MPLDDEARFRAVSSRDRRFDGVFYTAVHTTGIYCRPSCPAVTPRRRNVSFHRTAAAAQMAGFRACKRCLPDATPGSPEWDLQADAAHRAMRLIHDGVVEREGVAGLAARLGYSSRHLHRMLLDTFGAGAQSLARSRRAQVARVLLQSTDLTASQIAFAAGFASIRQFNDTVREIYATTPTQLRGTAPHAGVLSVRMAVREPFDTASMVGFLQAHAVPGLETATGRRYARTLALPHGPGVAEIDFGRQIGCRFHLSDNRDLAPAWDRVRRLLDADADPVAVDTTLAGDPALAPSVARTPGLRVPGPTDGFEIAVRAILGQQVSLRWAVELTARLVREHGTPLGLAHPALTHLFPRPDAIAALDPESLPMPRSRGRALVALGAAVADGVVRLDGSMDRNEAHAALLALPGVGPWTADYVAMRALGDPDRVLRGDVAIRRGAAALGIEDLASRQHAWRPWGSYASMHLWAAASDLTADLDADPNTDLDNHPGDLQ